MNRSTFLKALAVLPFVRLPEVEPEPMVTVIEHYTEPPFPFVRMSSPCQTCGGSGVTKTGSLEPQMEVLCPDCKFTGPYYLTPSGPSRFVVTAIDIENNTITVESL